MAVRRMQGALRQADARTLAADLAAALAEGDAMVDLSQVTQADAGVLQVLIAASALADRTGHRLHLDIPEGSAVAIMAEALALPRVGLPMPDPDICDQPAVVEPEGVADLPDAGLPATAALPAAVQTESMTGQAL